MTNAELSLHEFKGDNVNIKMFLAPATFDIHGHMPPLGDGASHPLSDFYATLTAAQVDYPNATDLSNELAAVLLQTGIDTVFALGGGITGRGGRLQIPEGIWLVHDITLRPMVFLIGAGFGCTTLKLPDGKNTFMFKSDGFDTLFPTIVAHTDPAPPLPDATPDLSMGIWGFGIESMALDGNKANNSAGDGVLIYGYNFCLRHLMVFNFAGVGLTTGWSNAADFPRWTDAMETYIEHIKVHENDGDGWHMNGPHDSMVSNVQCYENSGYNFWLGRNGDSNFTYLHCYGPRATVAARFDEESHLTNCWFETALQVELQMNAGLNGEAVIFSGDTDPTYVNSKGLVIGDATHTPIGNVRLKTFIFNCQAGLIDTTYASGGGGNKLEMKGFNTAVTPLLFVGGTSLPAFASALANLDDYDWDIRINSGGLCELNADNRTGVRQYDLTIQGPDTLRAIGLFLRSVSAVSPTYPMFQLIRNGSSPTTFQIVHYDGTTFTNIFEYNALTGLIRLLGTVFNTVPAKGTIMVGLDTGMEIVWYALPPGADGDMLRADSTQPAGIRWLPPFIKVTEGGTERTALGTGGSVLLGQGTSPITWATNGGDHTVLKGNSGGDPFMARLDISELTGLSLTTNAVVAWNGSTLVSIPGLTTSVTVVTSTSSPTAPSFLLTGGGSADAITGLSVTTVTMNFTEGLYTS